LFSHYYAAAVRAGCDVSAWDTELERIKAKYIFNETRCHKLEAADLTKETADVAGAVLTDAPLYEQLREAVEVRTQAEATVKAIIAKINAEKAAEGQPNTRTNVRNHVANLEAVKQRRAS